MYDMYGSMFCCLCGFRLQEVMLKEMTSFETLDETPMQMYLSGRHHLKEDNAPGPVSFARALGQRNVMARPRGHIFAPWLKAEAESWQLDAARLAGFDEVGN